MNNRKDSENLNDWLDFSVPSNSCTSSAFDLYESYKVYKNHLKSLPKSELISRGWIASKDDVLSLANYFRDIHSEKNQAFYRKADNANSSLVSLWLSKVKSQAELAIFLQSFPSFSGIDKHALFEIARLSIDVGILPKLPDILSKYGIVLVYMRALPAMKLDGAVFKISSGNPVIGMSLRYSRLDNFWFTLLHELSHIHLHMGILDEPILDDLDIFSDSEIEISANRLAINSFVERKAWRNCEPRYNKDPEAIDRFASKIGVHRSIIAGMLQHELGNYVLYSNIVNEYDAREIVFNGS